MNPHGNHYLIINGKRVYERYQDYNKLLPVISAPQANQSVFLTQQNCYEHGFKWDGDKRMFV